MADKGKLKQLDKYLRKFANFQILAGTLTKPVFMNPIGDTEGSAAALAFNSEYLMPSHKVVFTPSNIKKGYPPESSLSYHFSRMEGGIGMYLALTGSSITARDAINLGLTRGQLEFDDSIRNKMIELSEDISMNEVYNPGNNSEASYKQTRAEQDEREKYAKKYVELVSGKNNTGFSSVSNPYAEADYLYGKYMMSRRVDNNSKSFKKYVFL